MASHRSTSARESAPTNPSGALPRTISLALAQGGPEGTPAVPGAHGTAGQGGKVGSSWNGTDGADGAWGADGADGSGGRAKPSYTYALKTACPDSGEGDAVNSPGQQGFAGGDGHMSNDGGIPRPVGGQPVQTAAQHTVTPPVAGVGQGGIGGAGDDGGHHGGGAGSAAERSTSQPGVDGSGGTTGTSGTSGGNGYVRLTLVS
ncbi:hypothetical protein ACIQ6Y_19305 [Streptomyces sp. NPDC096205]|uniref:hypothetical protein n=1 Tax=Streptomyces sp. NPDC096205 TaxID=3366081 RepID=UPI0038161829